MKRNKYGAKKTDCLHGHTHDSGREAKRCNELHLLYAGEEISGLETQKQFWFVVDGKQLKHAKGRRCGMKADFFYYDHRDNRKVAEDSKGMTVRDYPLRAALFRHCFPEIELREV